MSTPWVSEVINELCRMKRSQLKAGQPLDFEQAWAAVMLKCPPRGAFREIAAENLFEAAQEAEPLAVFLRRVCCDAYYDRKSHLRHLRMLLDSSGPDDVFRQVAA